MTSDYKNRKYSIVPYDPSWKDLFAVEKEVVGSVFGSTALVVEHIGSTAVPGMAGKPTIDLLVTVEDISRVDQFNVGMEALGYEALGEYAAKGARLFVKEEDGVRLSNIHVFLAGFPQV